MSVEELAAGLTKAQREAILGEPNNDMPADVAMSFMAMRLFRPVSVEPPQMAWSPTGLAVRSYLMENGHSTSTREGGLLIEAHVL